MPSDFDRTGKLAVRLSSLTRRRFCGGGALVLLLLSLPPLSPLLSPSLLDDELELLELSRTTRRRERPRSCGCNSEDDDSEADDGSSSMDEVDGDFSFCRLDFFLAGFCLTLGFVLALVLCLSREFMSGAWCLVLEVSGLDSGGVSSSELEV